jgi:hypothetical protein
VLLIAGLIAYKMIPVKVKAADMRDTVTDEAKSAGTNRDDTKILKRILAKAQELNLPLAEEDVKIQRASGMIRIEVSYTVPVEFPGYTYHWAFHHKAENPLF